MIELYKFGPAFGLRETGPFVLKTMSYMRLAGIEFTEHVETDPVSYTHLTLPTIYSV